MSEKLPHIQFYTGDWLKDPVLRRCSKAEKGFLIDALCILHENEDRGVFSTGASAWSREEIAYAVGGDAAENLSLLDSVLQKGALRINEAKAIYSRRIVRDEERRRVKRKNGSKGGSKTAAKRVAKGVAKAQRNPDTDTDIDNDSVSSSSKEKRKPPKRKGRPDSEDEVVEFCVSIDLPKSDGLATWLKWQGNGFSNKGQPMKCWKSTIRSWKANGYMGSQKANQNQGTFNGFNSRPNRNDGTANAERDGKSQSANIVRV